MKNKTKNSLKYVLKKLYQLLSRKQKISFVVIDYISRVNTNNTQSHWMVNR